MKQIHLTEDQLVAKVRSLFFEDSPADTTKASESGPPLSQEGVDQIIGKQLVAEWDAMMAVGEKGRVLGHVAGPIADLYLVDIKFHCNGVCNRGAIGAMEQIIGREFFEGRLRMNANQLVQLLLAQRDAGDGADFGSIRQYEIVAVEKDRTGVIDVSGA